MFKAMSRYGLRGGRTAWATVLLALVSMHQGRTASGEEFWDETFGVPGVPYDEGVVSSMLAVGIDVYVGGVYTRIAGLSTTSIARDRGGRTGRFSSDAENFGQAGPPVRHAPAYRGTNRPPARHDGLNGGRPDGHQLARDPRQGAFKQLNEQGRGLVPVRRRATDRTRGRGRPRPLA